MIELTADMALHALSNRIHELESQCDDQQKQLIFCEGLLRIILDRYCLEEEDQSKIINYLETL